MKKINTFEKDLLLFIKEHAIESSDLNSLESLTLQEKINYFNEIVLNKGSDIESCKEIEPLKRFVSLLSSDLPTNLKDVLVDIIQETHDKKTPVASVLVSTKNKYEILSAGTNKSIIDAKRIDWWRDNSEKDTKDNYCVCSEVNCILNYLKNNDIEQLINENPIIVVTIKPCYTCTRLIANVGIKNILYIDKYNPQPENTHISAEIIKEHKISVFTSWNDFLKNSSF